MRPIGEKNGELRVEHIRAVELGRGETVSATKCRQELRSGRMGNMKIVTGTVTDGTIVVEGQPFSEGEKVTVLSYGMSEPFRVSPEEKRVLLESMAQAERGESIDAEELLAELDESN